MSLGRMWMRAARAMWGRRVGFGLNSAGISGNSRLNFWGRVAV